MNQPLRILLVEDNDGDVLLVREALTLQGLDFELIEIDDAEEALDHFHRLRDDPSRSCPDAVILDLNIPKGNGLDLLRTFREQCARTPVIVFTSSDSPRDREGVAAVPATTYFRKPLDLDEFMRLGEVVRTCVAAGRG